MRATLVLLTISLLTAGCLSLPEDPRDDQTPPVATGGPGSMSASERQDNTSGLCSSDVFNNGEGNFCATRTITVTGSISGMSALDVAVESFNGPVLVESEAEGKWGFVAVLVGRGESADEAEQRLRSIEFTWTHQRAGSHLLEVIAKKDRDAEGRSADIHVKIPRSILLSLTAGTVNGKVTAQGVRTSELALGSVNGDIVADVEVMSAELGTTNGDVEAKLRPIGAGRVNAGTTNGGIALKLPEGDAYGYQVQAATTNGDVDITLRDGEVGPCPEGSEYYTPPCNSRTFETRDFDARTYRTYVQAGSTNGGIDLSPL